jgi:hypothetical protein
MAKFTSGRLMVYPNLKAAVKAARKFLRKQIQFSTNVPPQPPITAWWANSTRYPGVRQLHLQLLAPNSAGPVLAYSTISNTTNAQCTRLRLSKTGYTCNINFYYLAKK